MAITYAWQIISIHTDSDDNIEHIRWRKVGTDDVDGTTGKVLGETNLVGDHTAEGWIPFASVTEANISDWLTAATAAKESRLNARINADIIENRLTKRDFPWA